MLKITNTENPLSFLQQRINYAEKQFKNAIYFVENVPEKKNFGVISNDLNQFNKYCSSSGLNLLLEQICIREYTRYKLNLGIKNLLISNGGMHALSLIFKFSTFRGKKVICQGPVFAGVAELLKSFHFVIEYLPENIDENALKKIFKDHKDACLFYINIPNNPTGKIYRNNFLFLILDLVKQHDMHIITDLVYDDFIFGEDRHFNPLKMTNDWDRVFTINSMSKNYGLPGIRVGWIASSQKNILALSKLLEDECVCISTISQNIALNAMNYGNNDLITSVSEGKILAENFLTTTEDLSSNKPEGGTQLFVRFPVRDIDLFADYMLVKYKLVLATSSNYVGSDLFSIRIPIGVSKDRIIECLKTLTCGFKEYKKEENCNL